MATVNLIVFVVTTVVVLLIMLFMSTLFLRKARESCATIGERWIEFVDLMGVRRTLELEDIGQIILRRTKQGRLREIQLRGGYHRRVRIVGLSKMEKLGRVLTKAAPNATIETKTSRIDGSSPLVTMATMVVIGAIYLGLRLEGASRGLLTALILPGTVLAWMYHRSGR